jgi:hypothetical protein
LNFLSGRFSLYFFFLWFCSSSERLVRRYNDFPVTAPSTYLSWKNIQRKQCKCVVEFKNTKHIYYRVFKLSGVSRSWPREVQITHNSCRHSGSKIGNSWWNKNNLQPVRHYANWRKLTEQEFQSCSEMLKPSLRTTVFKRLCLALSIGYYKGHRLTKPSIVS